MQLACFIMQVITELFTKDIKIKSVCVICTKLQIKILKTAEPHPLFRMSYACSMHTLTAQSNKYRPMPHRAS